MQNLALQARASANGMRLITITFSLALPLLMALGLAPALAQNWPTKPVRIINPYAAGGPTELVARELANALSVDLGQQFIVESRPGGGTIIGAEIVAKANPDGYTLLATTLASVIVQPAINPKLPYNAEKDLIPVGLYSTIPNLIAVHPSVPVKTVRELIDYAKKEGSKLNYGSAGPGTGPHLAGELFKRMAGVEMTHVGYKGAAPAVLDIVAGQIQVSFLNITPQVPHVKAGKLRALAVTGAHRSALLPDVPTVNELALPGYVTESWNGIMTTGGTPRPVIDTLSRAMLRVMATDNMKNRMMTLGADVTPLGPDEFAAYVKADDKRLTPIIKSLDMKSN